MPRSESEIQADIDAMKASGVHQSSGKLKPLREELKAARAANAPAPAFPPPVCVPPPTGVTTVSGTSSAAVAPIFTAEVEHVSRWGSEEDFIDRALIEVAAGLEFKGMTTNVVKNLYQRLDAVLKLRRILKEVFDQIGPGENLPPFTKIGRDPNTGERTFEVSHTPFPGIQTPKTQPDIPHITEGGDPVRGRPSRAEIMAQVMGGGAPAAAAPVMSTDGIKASILGQISQRPAPAPPQSATG